MKDLVRLLMVAVLSFAVVGVALVYSRDSDALGQWTKALGARVDKVQEATGSTPAAAEAESRAPARTRLWIARPQQDVWMGLAGFPDQYDLRFAIPSGMRFVAGSLDLTFESVLAEHGDGRMTIAVNGKRRGEIVFNTGRETHKVTVDLDEEDLLGAYIVLELSGRGTTNSGQICPTDAANSGVAITLLPTSGLELYTNDSIERPDVKLASLAEPMSISLGTEGREQVRAIWAAQALERFGVQTRLVLPERPADLVIGDDTGEALRLDTEGRLVIGGAGGIERLVARRAPQAVAVTPAQWPVTIDRLGVETLAKNFRGSRRWTIPFALADLPAGAMPGTLALSLKTSRLTEGNDWVVRISLNGNLLTSERFAGESDVIDLVVDLPTAMQGLSNTLLVELIDTTPNDSICRAGPDAQAQLLPHSHLTATGGKPASGWAEIVRGLARAETVGLVRGAELTLQQAQRARALLSSFLPRDARMSFGADAAGSDVQLTIMSVEQLLWSINVAARRSEGVGDGAAGLYFAVAGMTGEGGEPALIDLSDAAGRAQLALLDDADVGILIGR